MCYSSICIINNENLVAYLKDAGYIKSDSVEKIFRAVDRGEFIWDCNPPPQAYWSNTSFEWGNCHVSGPCVYGVTMEAFKLESGMSFLNLGSGTGYLSTLVGLALGVTGINHGIELYPDVVEIAKRKLKLFKTFSEAPDEFDFCEPQFLQGNFLALPQGCRQYDRVYCGVRIPPEKLDFLKTFVKVGGILVTALSDVALYRMMRLPGDKWTEELILKSTFQFTIPLPEGSTETCRLPDIVAPTLQELARAKIKQVLRNSIDTDFPKEMLFDPRPREEDGEGEDEVRQEEIESLSDEEEEEEEEKAAKEKWTGSKKRMYRSLYSPHIEARISSIILPPLLNRYLMHGRGHF